MNKNNNLKSKSVFQKAVDKLIDNIQYGWIAITSLYFFVLSVIFLGMWSYLLEPAGIPEKLSENQSMFSSRFFLHFLIAAVLTSHFSLFISISALKKLATKQKKYRNDNDSGRKVLLIAGNSTAVKLIDVIIELGHEIVAIYDKNSDAEGIIYASEKGIPTYSHSPDELRKMLRKTRDNPKECYFIFIPTEYAPYLTRADEIIRSLRKDTKNIRFYRLGIDFDENVDKEEIDSLLT